LAVVLAGVLMLLAGLGLRRLATHRAYHPTSPAACRSDGRG
jgi:hypothetical protein